VTYKDKGDDDSKDSDIDPDTSMTDVITLYSGDYNMSVDAGFFECGAPIGVYKVIEMKGYSTSVDLSGLKVKVYDKSGKLVAVGVSDENGMVKFDNLPAGDYRFEYEKVDGVKFEMLTPTSVDSSFEINEREIAQEGSLSEPSVQEIQKAAASAVGLGSVLLVFSLMVMVRRVLE